MPKLPVSLLAWLGSSASWLWQAPRALAATTKPPPLSPLPSFDIPCRLALNPACNNLSLVVNAVINWMIAIAGLIFVVMFFVGGIQYLTSAGDPGATTKAKNTLLAALIGIIVVVAAYAGVQLFVGAIG